MPYDLPAMVARQGIRRPISLRPINPTQSQAQDLARIYLAALKPWQDVDALLRGYTGGLTTDAPSDQAAAIEQAEGEVTRLIVEFTARLRGWTIRLERWERSKWSDAVRSATGIDLSSMLTAGPVEMTVETFIQRNVDLVKDVSQQAKGRIADAIWRGYEAKLPAREVAKDIRKATGMARDRSLRIASHQTANLATELDRERRAEAGLTLFRYRHGGKVNFRPWHKARDGRIYDSKTGKQVNPDGSRMAGGDVIEASDRPGRPPWCSCREQAYIPLMDELGI